MIIDEKKLEFLTNNQPLFFEDAMYLFRVGKKLTRLAWRNDLSYPRHILIKKEMSTPGFEPYFEADNGKQYNLSTADILAEDWMLA